MRTLKIENNSKKKRKEKNGINNGFSVCAFQVAFLCGVYEGETLPSRLELSCVPLPIFPARWDTHAC